jgi:hypothetical protein
MTAAKVVDERRPVASAIIALSALKRISLPFRKKNEWPTEWSELPVRGQIQSGDGKMHRISRIRRRFARKGESSQESFSDYRACDGCELRGIWIIPMTFRHVFAVLFVCLISMGCSQEKGYGIALMNRSHQTIEKVAVLSGDSPSDRLRASAGRMAHGAFQSFSIAAPLAKSSDVQWQQQGGSAQQVSVKTDVPQDFHGYAVFQFDPDGSVQFRLINNGDMNSYVEQSRR